MFFSIIQQERRRRQRFYRTLKPNALFELVSMPTDASGGTSSNQTCTSSNQTCPRAEDKMSGFSNNVRQSDFRHTSPGNSVEHDTQSGLEQNTQQERQNDRTLLNMDPTPEQTQEDFFMDSDELNENLSVIEASLPPPPSLPVTHAQTEVVPQQLNMFSKDSVKYYNLQVDMNFMPPNIKRLYRTICDNFSDYAFVYALSAQLCQDEVPMECFVYLKMALLCSLASFEAGEVRAPISLCVICNDSSIAHNILQSMGQLAQRFVGAHEGGQQQAFSALPTRHTWVQAMPLLMAQQGVYYAGDWNRLSRDQAEELEKCLENGNVTIQQQSNTQMLETAIWTYWQPENAVNEAQAFAKLCP